MPLRAVIIELAEIVKRGFLDSELAGRVQGLALGRRYFVEPISLAQAQSLRLAQLHPTIDSILIKPSDGKDDKLRLCKQTDSAC